MITYRGAVSRSVMFASFRRLGLFKREVGAGRRGTYGVEGSRVDRYRNELHVVQALRY